MKGKVKECKCRLPQYDPLMLLLSHNIEWNEKLCYCFCFLQIDVFILFKICLYLH